VALSEESKRAWVALGITETLFAGVYPVGFLMALPFVDKLDGDAGTLALLWLFFAAPFVAVVGIPLAVHTAGRHVARLTDEWSRTRAAIAQLATGLGAGVLAGAALVALSPMPVPAAAVALVMPSGVAALGTCLLMPLALRHQWIRIAAWALGGAPVVLALIALLAVVGGGVFH
jgi:hypothetical protein